MKKSILAIVAVVALAFVGCDEKAYINDPGDNNFNYDSIPVFIADTNGIEISVDSAIAICKQLKADEVTAEMYKLSGVITSLLTKAEDIPGKYTNINFLISDNGGKTSLKCYYMNNLNNAPFRKSSDVPRAGSKVTVVGLLTNYNGEAEMKNGYFVRIEEPVEE